MNSDQRLVAWMVVLLIGLVAWTTYKPWLKAVLFTPTQGSSGGSTLFGVPWNPYTGIIPLGMQTPSTGAGSAGTPLVPGATLV